MRKLGKQKSVSWRWQGMYLVFANHYIVWCCLRFPVLSFWVTRTSLRLRAGGGRTNKYKVKLGRRRFSLCFCTLDAILYLLQSSFLSTPLFAQTIWIPKCWFWNADLCHTVSLKWKYSLTSLIGCFKKKTQTLTPLIDYSKVWLAMGPKTAGSPGLKNKNKKNYQSHFIEKADFWRNDFFFLSCPI